MRDIEMDLHDSLDRAMRKAKALRESHDRLVAALARCMPLMQGEWEGYGPSEPEYIALRRAAEALLAAEDV